MKHMGEDDASTEGPKPSVAWKPGGPVADTTLESPLNGRRRCTNIVDVLISQANGQSNSSSSAAF